MKEDDILGLIGDNLSEVILDLDACARHFRNLEEDRNISKASQLRGELGAAMRDLQNASKYVDMLAGFYGGNKNAE